MRKVVIIGLIVIIVAVGAWYMLKKGDKAPQYKTVAVHRTDLEAMVTATGTVNAVTTVLVGTQVSGAISALYVDYNSPVNKGHVSGPGRSGKGEPFECRGQSGKK